MSIPTRDEFIVQVLSAVGAKFPLVKIERSEEPFAVRVNGNLASLENVYRMSVLRPEQTKRHVERWMVELLRASEGAPDLEDDFEELKDRIMPMIVPEGQETDRPWVTQPLVPGLSVAYAIDNDRTISYLSPKRLAKWKTPIETLHDVAMENLLRRSETMNAHAAQDEQGQIYLILFQTMDGYDASRILLPNLHEKLREHLGSPFAAAIPNRDILLCFRDDAETVAKLDPQIKSDYGQMPHQVWDKVMLVTADGIAPRENGREGT